MQTSKSKIYFFYESAGRIRDINRIKTLLSSVFRSEGKSLARLNYIFSTDKRLLQINREFLNHDYYTDIITFELSLLNQPIQGEIYISVDRVRQNALELGETFSREMLRVIIHGALHLCGYSDKTVIQKAEMRAKEEKYLRRFQRST
jgi:probable rRNA maturation factor